MGARTWPNLTSALLRGDELETADTAWVRNRTSIVISSATSVSGGSAAPGFIPAPTSA